MMNEFLGPVFTVYELSNFTNTTQEESVVTVDQKLTPLTFIIAFTDSIFFVATFCLCCFFEFCNLYGRQRLSRLRRGTNDTDQPFLSSDSSSEYSEDEDGVISSSDSNGSPSTFQQPPECKEFGMMKIVCLRNSPRGLVYLTFERFMFFMWYFLSVVLNHYVWFNIFPDDRFLSHYQYLSNCTFFITFIYYLMSVVLTSFYYFDLYWEVGESTLGIRVFLRNYILEPCIYLDLVCLEVASVVSWIVSLMFGTFIVPMSYKQGITLIFNYPVISIHVISTIFITTEVLLLSVLRYRCRHFIILFTLTFSYYCWTTFLVKTRVIKNYPYYGLMSYDNDEIGWLALILRYVILILVFLIFMCYWFMTFSRYIFVTKYWMKVDYFFKQLQLRRTMKKWFSILEREQVEESSDSGEDGDDVELEEVDDIDEREEDGEFRVLEGTKEIFDEVVLNENIDE